ncbi:MAG: HPr family phosphocarrier protein [Pyrinomonadaceae bacterium]
MLETDIKVINQLGLHARAAAQLVRLAGKFSSTIIIKRKNNKLLADAKSILSILALAASKGTILILEVEGTDEKNAFEEIKMLFANGFGEM